MKKVITKAIFVNHLNETIGLSKKRMSDFFRDFYRDFNEKFKEQKRCKDCKFWNI